MIFYYVQGVTGTRRVNDDDKRLYGNKSTKGYTVHFINYIVNSYKFKQNRYY